MFFKQVVCLSTAAGRGMKTANQDMAHSGFFWGARTYSLGFAVMETAWERVSPKKKQAMERRLDRLAGRLRKNQSRKPGLKTRLFFAVMSRVQRHGWNPADAKYWQENGWTKEKRPWND